MGLAGRYFEALTGLKEETLLPHFEGQLAFKNIEELPRMNMEVTNFASAGRHELFNNAEIGCPDEMPTVAVVFVGTTPFVMLGSLPAGDRCHLGNLALQADLSYSFWGTFRIPR